MNCLCCGKPLRAEDANRGWHSSCIKKFFGTTDIPEIEIDKLTLEQLAAEGTKKGLTVPGVQKKLSLHLSSDKKNPRLTLVNYPTGYILKPQAEGFTALPEAEQLVMSMADECRISTVPHALIRQDGTYAYITRRIDRAFTDSHISMIAMEDFCQLDGRLTQDKYKGSYERCAKVIRKYSSRSGLDLAEFFIRIVFCFITANSDMHLKNFSLVEDAEGSTDYVLSPAYDLLPVNIVMPEDKEETALTLNGKKKNLRRKDFLALAASCGIPRNAAEKMISSLTSKKPKLLEMCSDSLLPDPMREQFQALIERRCSMLE